MVRRLIADGCERELGLVIRDLVHAEMMDVAGLLRQLMEPELVLVRTAYTAAPRPHEVRMRLDGITVAGGGIIG